MTLVPREAAEKLRAEARVDSFEQALDRSDAAIASCDSIEVAQAVLADVEQAVAAASALRGRIPTGEVLTRLRNYLVRASASMLRTYRRIGELCTEDEGVARALTGERGYSTATVRRLKRLAKVPVELFDKALRDAVEKGLELTQKDVLDLLKPAGAVGGDGAPEPAFEQIAFRITDPELLRLLDRERKVGREVTRTDFARRALELVLRPTSGAGREIHQRALEALDHAPRLEAKIAFAEEEAQVCATKFGQRPWKAIANALAAALDEVRALAPPAPEPEPEEDVDGDE